MSIDDSHMITKWKVTYEYSGKGIVHFMSKEAKDRFVAELKESHTSASCEVEEIRVDERQLIVDGLNRSQQQKLRTYAEKRNIPLIEALDHLFKHYVED